MEPNEPAALRGSRPASFAIRALLFDFDDTIVESEKINDAHFVEFLRSEYSIALPPEDAKLIFGYAWSDVFS